MLLNEFLDNYKTVNLDDTIFTSLNDKNQTNMAAPLLDVSWTGNNVLDKLASLVLTRCNWL